MAPAPPLRPLAGRTRCPGTLVAGAAGYLPAVAGGGSQGVLDCAAPTGVVPNRAAREGAADDRTADVPRGSDLHLAAIDVQVGSENEAALFGSEERHHVGDLVRTPDPAEWDTRGES